MKQFGLGLMVLFFVLGCANMSVIRSRDVAGEPTAYCKVVHDPNPVFMGGWKCGYNRHVAGTQEYDYNPIAFWLVKKDGKYALYFYRATRGGAKRYVGWRDWTINGDEIYSGTGVRFVAKGGEVYYIWRDQKPEKMTRFTIE